MIKNIVLDMGNVLLDYNPSVPLKAFCHSEAESEIIKKELFEGPEWILGDLGAIKDSERFDLVKKRVPKEYWDSLKLCCDKWDICMKPLKGAMEFYNTVKSRGSRYRIFVLSNASDTFYDYFPKYFPLNYFDGIVVSSDIHIVKPNKEIYEYLLNRYNLIAEECLFIDDRQDNTDGALAVGMQAYRFKNDFDRIIEKFGL